MLVIDNGDAIRGIAEVATQLDFIVNGYVGTTATQLADGQLGTAEANLYLSGADATVVTSITIVNTDSAARTFTLYLKPSGGTSRAISPISLDLGIGHSFYTDGQRVVVLDKSGNVLSTATVLSHALGGSSHDADTLSNLNSKISDATLVDTASIVLKALFDANTILAATSDNTPAALTVAASRILGRKASGNIAAMTVAELLTLINVAAGADVTGNNAPQAHKDSHDPNTGGDALDTASGSTIQPDDAAATGTADSLSRSDHKHAIVGAAPSTVGSANSEGSSTSFARADHIHNREHAIYVDASAVSAVEAAGLTFAENKGIILDAALSADGKWSGVVETGTSGSALAFGDIVYFKTSDSRWWSAKADVAATSKDKIGIVVTAVGGAGQAITLLLYGKVRADAVFPALTIGAPVHISAATAGDIVVAAPTGTTNFVVRIIGYGNTADELFFCPDNTYIELA